jgi:AcrR family transcriptional regulator
MPTKIRSNYHHGDLHAALIRASDEIITEGGVEAFSLRVAAKRAGVSPSAPTHHFGNARGLLTEVAILAFNRCLEYIEAGADFNDVVADVRGVSQGFIQFALDYPGHFRLMFRNDLTDKDNPRLREAFSKPGYRLGSSILSYKGRANFDLEKFEDAADLLAGVSTLHGVVELILEGGAANIFQIKGDGQFSPRHIKKFIERLYPEKR